MQSIHIAHVHKKVANALEHRVNTEQTRTFLHDVSTVQWKENDFEGNQVEHSEHWDENQRKKVPSNA